tara:strand:+ start:54 stop:524 length:471 start_codon:yes stop_codon:yes gene_type:complete
MVNVTGSGKTKRQMVESIAEYAIGLLMPRLKGKLDIRIELVACLKAKESIAGDCIWEDRSHKPREFTIRVDSTQPRQDMLETVAHEMVHVKQYSRGELKDVARSIKYCRWNGKEINTSRTNYFDQPWEIEAHGREKGIFVRWLEQSKWKDVYWADY